MRAAAVAFKRATGTFLKLVQKRGSFGGLYTYFFTSEIKDDELLKTVHD